MSGLHGAPPTALERLRSHMQESRSRVQMFHSERESTRNTFRESVRGFLEVEKLSKIPMTGKDLQEFTTIKFYASYSFVNFASFSCVLGVTFCLGVMGWGRDIKDDYKSIHDNYQVRGGKIEFVASYPSSHYTQSHPFLVQVSFDKCVLDEFCVDFRFSARRHICVLPTCLLP